MEAGSISYKITVSIEPITDEGTHRSVKESFSITLARFAAEDKFWKLVDYLKHKFNCKSLAGNYHDLPVWIKNQSLTQKQHGFISERLNSGAYKIFFPNGLGENNNPCYLEFLEEFVSEKFNG